MEQQNSFEETISSKQPWETIGKAPLVVKLDKFYKKKYLVIAQGSQVLLEPEITGYIYMYIYALEITILFSKRWAIISCVLSIFSASRGAINESYFFLFPLKRGTVRSSKIDKSNVSFPHLIWVLFLVLTGRGLFLFWWIVAPFLVPTDCGTILCFHWIVALFLVPTE